MRVGRRREEKSRFSETNLSLSDYGWSMKDIQSLVGVFQTCERTWYIHPDVQRTK